MLFSLVSHSLLSLCLSLCLSLSLSLSLLNLPGIYVCDNNNSHLLYFWFQDLFYTLIDSIDGGYHDEIPDIPSYLPGLKRSAYLTSQAQLDSLVREREGKREREREREREGERERESYLIHLPSNS